MFSVIVLLRGNKVLFVGLKTIDGKLSYRLHVTHSPLSIAAPMSRSDPWEYESAPEAQPNKFASVGH